METLNGPKRSDAGPGRLRAINFRQVAIVDAIESGGCLNRIFKPPHRRMRSEKNDFDHWADGLNKLERAALIRAGWVAPGDAVKVPNPDDCLLNAIGGFIASLREDQKPVFNQLMAMAREVGRLSAAQSESSASVSLEALRGAVRELAERVEAETFCNCCTTGDIAETFAQQLAVELRTLPGIGGKGGV